MMCSWARSAGSWSPQGMVNARAKKRHVMAGADTRERGNVPVAQQMVGAGGTEHRPRCPCAMSFDPLKTAAHVATGSQFEKIALDSLALLFTKTSWSFAFASATARESWRIACCRGAGGRGTSMAGDRSVTSEPVFAGLPPRDDEFVGQAVRGAEVHFVGRPAGERRMRHLRVVLLDEEGDERFEMSHG